MKFEVKMLKLLLSLFVLLCISDAMPLARRLVDMTHVFDNTVQDYPGVSKNFNIDELLNGTLEDFGMWLQFEEYSSGTHIGTHMDSPSHFILGQLNIDQYPITEFFAPAAVLDITAKAELDPDYLVTVEDLQQWESGTGQNFNGSIILLRTGWSHKWNDRAAFLGNPNNDPDNLHFPGLSPEASQWLVDNRNIKGIGSDAMSIDKGLSKDYPSHIILLRHGLYILENVDNVDKIPIYGAQLFVLPTKIGDVTGAPVRIIASVPEVIYKLPDTEI